MTGTGRKGADLAGARILVVEDEYYIADDLAAYLDRRGGRVLGPVGTVREALDLLDAGTWPDAAVLDLRLHGERAAPLCDLLAERGVPFVVTTGYGAEQMPERHLGVRRLEKPCDVGEVAAVIRRLLDGASHAS